MTIPRPCPSVEAILKKLAPETIRSNLVRAGLFLAGWEILKSEVQEKVRDFFLEGFDGSDFVYSARYKARVLDRHQSRFEASLLWLVETEALTKAQAARVRVLRDRRNEIAHELPKLLVDPDHAGVDLAVIQELKDLIGGLGVFWGHIEVDTNPYFVDQEVADADIKSGVSILMEHLVAAADEAGPGNAVR